MELRKGFSKGNVKGEAPPAEGQKGWYHVEVDAYRLGWEHSQIIY